MMTDATSPRLKENALSPTLKSYVVYYDTLIAKTENLDDDHLINTDIIDNSTTDNLSSPRQSKKFKPKPIVTKESTEKRKSISISPGNPNYSPRSSSLTSPNGISYGVKKSPLQEKVSNISYPTLEPIEVEKPPKIITPIKTYRKALPKIPVSSNSPSCTNKDNTDLNNEKSSKSATEPPKEEVEGQNIRRASIPSHLYWLPNNVDTEIPVNELPSSPLSSPIISPEIEGPKSSETVINSALSTEDINYKRRPSFSERSISITPDFSENIFDKEESQSKNDIISPQSINDDQLLSPEAHGRRRRSSISAIVISEVVGNGSQSPILPPLVERELSNLKEPSSDLESSPISQHENSTDENEYVFETSTTFNDDLSSEIKDNSNSYDNSLTESSDVSVVPDIDCVSILSSQDENIDDAEKLYAVSTNIDITSNNEKMEKGNINDTKRMDTKTKQKIKSRDSLLVTSEFNDNILMKEMIEKEISKVDEIIDSPNSCISANPDFTEELLEDSEDSSRFFHLYQASHGKLCDPTRTLREQLMISNLMLVIVTSDHVSSILVNKNMINGDIQSTNVVPTPRKESKNALNKKKSNANSEDDQDKTVNNGDLNESTLIKKVKSSKDRSRKKRSKSSSSIEQQVQAKKIVQAGLSQSIIEQPNVVVKPNPCIVNPVMKNGTKHINQKGLNAHPQNRISIGPPQAGLPQNMTNNNNYNNNQYFMQNNKFSSKSESKSDIDQQNAERINRFKLYESKFLHYRDQYQMEQRKLYNQQQSLIHKQQQLCLLISNDLRNGVSPPEFVQIQVNQLNAQSRMIQMQYKTNMNDFQNNESKFIYRKQAFIKFYQTLVMPNNQDVPPLYNNNPNNMINVTNPNDQNINVKLGNSNVPNLIDEKERIIEIKKKSKMAIPANAENLLSSSKKSKGSHSHGGEKKLNVLKGLFYRSDKKSSRKSNR